ncbi:Na/Pi cotransporter family protein (plasmid) [Deinococcus metallilatus]|uniref:Na/Pi cotransporter family protein n=1 Tax=Deinococcus metallilatus TaxID=1211322 RepID=A0AAJ5F682_9DEIO|nr:Na/Pi symporter [Deinococcus metallilatus]MBB5295683.1 phosphate:Na+ symporter [Deinococcus metallilatus]QBY06863.1 Na/Pi cotransporter family protein [Deinococcus metallilatus]TLK32252.1 Na/Pi cotransporter family protein [Deinococcus metallilatus]GMA14213.1 sodium:phosphate symporter [Deinococcus metallilatus]
MLFLLGGLALFLFGVRLVGENLQLLLGPRLRRLLASATRSGPRAALTGALVTALAQSGTLVTVLTITLVDAGVLGLRQALAVALGASVGGTLTVQLLAFKITHLAMPLLALGLLLSWPRLLQGRLGRIAIGLGLLFLGLDTMLGSLQPLRGSLLFAQVLAALAQSPLVLAAIGLVLTALVHSSNATATLALAFVSGGLLTAEQGVALVIGANVGTTFSAVLVSAHGPVDGRRVAVGHLGVKAIGALATLAVLNSFMHLLARLGAGPERLIANAHTLFNLLVLLAVLPLGRSVTRLLQRLIPTPPSEDTPRYLSADALDRPELAYGLAFREVLRISEEVESMYALATKALQGETTHAELSLRENTVDDLVNAVVLYLGRLGAGQPHARYVALFGTASELEAIADLCKRLARQPLKLHAHGSRFAPEGSRELVVLALELKERMHATFTALTLRNAPNESGPHFSAEVAHQRMLHLYRLVASEEAQRSSSVHLDILTVLEQIHTGLRRIDVLADQL